MRRRLRLVVIAVAMNTLFGTAASADQIALTGGVLDMELNAIGSAIGFVRLTGDRGFSFVGSMTGGFEQPIGNVLSPGQTITLDGSANGLGLTGTTTLDGVTYAGFGGLDSPAGGSLRFLATLTLPSPLNAPSSVVAPFALAMLLWLPGQDVHTVSGSGLATVSLGEDKGFGEPSWLVTGIRAEVSSTPAPVPEPATLLLTAPGLAWAGVRKRRSVKRLRSRRD